MANIGNIAFILFVLGVINASSGIDASSSGQIKYSVPRILGGIESEPGSAPFMVALMSTRFRGAGVIINKYHVLTTSACVPDDNFIVLVGIFDISTDDYDQRIPVDHVIRHVKDDVALVRLGYAIFFNTLVQPAVLPQRGRIHSGDVTLYGWGSSVRSHSFPGEARGYSTMNEAVINILPFGDCELIFGGPGKSPLNDRNICTGPLSGGIAPCTGDAGSPIVQRNEFGETEVVGLVSWGFIPCGGPGNPQVHIRTSGYIDWIISKLY